jgi:prepilin-type processing-associated H-X9-DG protein
MLEEHPNSINDAEFAVQMPLNPRATYFIDFPAKHYNNACDFSFADGHVESHQWQQPRVVPEEIWPADGVFQQKKIRDTHGRAML